MARSLPEVLKDALLCNALPGELDGFGPDEQQEAAEFVARCVEQRQPGEAIVCVESAGTPLTRRRMRVCIANDDMPFLVDSVANAIAGHDLVVHRLLHPIVSADRDPAGKLRFAECDRGGGGLRESIMYIECDRADARLRAALRGELEQVLADVRAAVADWSAMQAQMRADAEAATAEHPEGAALMQWFADGAMTLLGYEVERSGREGEGGLGLFRFPGEPTDEGGCDEAIRYFENGGQVPLMAKADRKSSIHRRVPLDLVAVPIRESGKVTAVGVHVGLWTSEALSAPVEDTPLLRDRLRQLEEQFGFEPTSHSGKALRHALSSLPHDLLLNLDTDSVRRLVVAAMLLADRPQPTLVLVRSILKGHLFAWVWLPREELSTRRRLAIGTMLEEASGGRQTAWSVDLGDGDLALIRYTFAVTADMPTPEEALLDRRLYEMVRGWVPALEERLVIGAGANRARRLTLAFGNAFPEAYRSRYPAADAAEDVLRLEALADESRRSVRLYRLPFDPRTQLRLKLYRRGELVPLSDVVPVLEFFGFTVLKETPTRLEGISANIHEFALDLADGGDAEALLARAEVIEAAIAAVLEGKTENDNFNQLIIAGVEPQAVVWLRAWFRYLRQTGANFGLATVADALRRAPEATAALVAGFVAAHDPALEGDRAQAMRDQGGRLDEALSRVQGIDDDRILRLYRSVTAAIIRTNAFALKPDEALAFKLNSALIPGLPRPVPWREIWVFSPRVEGIHLRGGPVARGGLRWSDRRDDFRTEILGLMKAQMVKNAVIVPTGAKGGFFPKQLPSPANREAWLAEGTEAYRIFIRSLLSVTDNIVEDQVVHPPEVVVHDGDDPYFVVAADKGTATFSDVANALALERNFWLGDAFASGGSNGYDHKAMGITAKGAWISVQRHFREMGIDIQSEPVTVAGCGDMSGDVFGNGMLLSKSIKLVAAFDHRHIFLDPNPDPAASWAERERMFNLPRSSWEDYDHSLISAGGGIFPRTQKQIPLSPEVRALLEVEVETIDPTSLINAILKAPVGLLWFGGIGTYVKASGQANSVVGDPANDVLRVNGSELRCKVIGEGANLATTQAGRIEFAEHGGRINTDFIDNSAGVDCSDNEVNIKIALNRDVRDGRTSLDERNALLVRMTDDVSDLVLEDNRLQTLALSIAEAGGARALPGTVRTIEILEASGRLDRTVEGLEQSDALLRRAQDGRGLTRPELAVVLSMSKLAMQQAAEDLRLADDPLLVPQLFAAFPAEMQQRHEEAIRTHRLRHEILATKVANRIVNRLGPSMALDITEEEGASVAQVITAFLAVEQLLQLDKLWGRIERAEVSEQVRIELFDQAARSVRGHLSDMLRLMPPHARAGELVTRLQPGLDKVNAAARRLIRAEVRQEAEARRQRLQALGAPDEIVRGLVKLYELDGVFGIAALGAQRHLDELALTRAYVRLGEALGLDWAQGQLTRFAPADSWERLLAAGLSRDFEALRIEWLGRAPGEDPEAAVEQWVKDQGERIDQFRRLVSRARSTGSVSVSMLAQIASQARILLAR
nr:NAD-glutamate dehydrogenase domain-containing protein [Sphingomonas ginkgonis]